MNKPVEKSSRTRAKYVLDQLEYLWAHEIERDEWVRLGQTPNVGAKTLLWMVEQKMLERRHRFTPVNDWYRIPPPEPDLGDLWVPENISNT